MVGAFRLALLGIGAGPDSAWEQEKLEVREKLENAAEAPTPSKCFVG